MIYHSQNNYQTKWKIIEYTITLIKFIFNQFKHLMSNTRVSHVYIKYNMHRIVKYLLYVMFII